MIKEQHFTVKQYQPSFIYFFTPKYCKGSIRIGIGHLQVIASGNSDIHLSWLHNKNHNKFKVHCSSNVIVYFHLL